MRYTDRPEARETAAPVQPPTECPACRSKNVVTASKVVTAASYWRCESCAEVWNAGRLEAARRNYSSRSPWR